jgi:hypothetical protein
MKTLIKALMIALFVTSCSTTENQEFRQRANLLADCPSTYIDKRAEFILSCVETSNSLSGSERVTILSSCGLISRDVFCNGGK